MTQQILYLTKVEYLYASFKKIIIFYDNDKPGIAYAKKLSEEIEAPYIHIPLELIDTKDISDYIQKYGLETTKQLIKELI